ncbi:hypothetical protein GW17_00027632 [Ensete ventricosum]|nr:hypothetical protein GW17_00027632 [Ensete ventricosum]
MQGDMNAYLRAFYRCQSLTWRQAACFCSYGSHEGNFAEREAFVSHLRGRYTSTSILKLLPFEFMLNLIHFLPHCYLVLLTKSKERMGKRRLRRHLGECRGKRPMVNGVEGKKCFCIRAWLVGVLDAWSIRARLDLNSYGF